MRGTLLLDRIRDALAAEYTVLDEIAAGGQGHVFRAHDPRLRRDVAIKVLRPELATAAAAARFLREAQVLARLKHPNILAVHDVGEADGLSFYVMDLAEGETLAARLARGPLPGPEVLSLARDLLAALDAAHRAGVVHRDVKPSNIFLHDSHAILADFGVAHVTADTADSTARTEPGRLLGTTGYMSPEQMLGAATPRSDLYSAACVLFEAAAGTAWDGTGDPEAADWSRVPPALVRPLCRALHLDPRSRWSDAREFRKAVEAPGGRRSPVRTLAVALLAGLTGYFAYDSIDRPAAASRPDRPPAAVDLAVVPFGRDAVGRQLASFVASALEWSPRWTFRPYRDVLAWWDSAGTGADAIATDRLNAEKWVDGFIREGDTLVLRINGRRGSAGMLTVPGSRADIVAWANAAADSIVGRVYPPERAAEFRELMSRSSSDYEANQLLIAGMDAFERDEWDRSEALLRAALDKDPRLDRAAFELDLVYRWRRKPLDPDLAPVVEAASRRIPEPYGTLIRSERELDLGRRMALLRSVVREYPDNARARFFLINESFHRAPLLGTPLAQVLETMEEGIRSSPYLNQIAMYDHLAWGYIHVGMADSAKSALRRRSALVEASVGADQFGSLLQLAHQARFTPFVARVRAWGAIRAYDPGPLARMLRFALTFDVPELQRQIGAGLADAEEPSVRVTARMAEGLALLQLGRAREGLARVDSAAVELGAEARVQALAWKIVPGTLGFDLLDSVGRAAAAEELRRVADAAESGALEARWILALDAASRGEAADSSWWSARYDSTPAAGYLGTILHGIDLARRGHADSALVATAPAIIDDSSGAVGSAFARAVLRIHRGRWHLALGRPGDADRSWLFYENSHLRGYPDGGVQAGEVDAVLSVYARLLRAELALAQRQEATACAFARRVRELWADADPVLLPFVSRAEGVVAACR